MPANIGTVFCCRKRCYLCLALLSRSLHIQQNQAGHGAINFIRLRLCGVCALLAKDHGIVIAKSGRCGRIDGHVYRVKTPGWAVKLVLENVTQFFLHSPSLNGTSVAWPLVLSALNFMSVTCSLTASEPLFCTLERCRYAAARRCNQINRQR